MLMASQVKSTWRSLSDQWLWSAEGKGIDEPLYRDALVENRVNGLFYSFALTFILIWYKLQYHQIAERDRDNWSCVSDKETHITSGKVKEEEVGRWLVIIRSRLTFDRHLALLSSRNLSGKFPVSLRHWCPHHSRSSVLVKIKWCVAFIHHCETGYRRVSRLAVSGVADRDSIRELTINMVWLTIGIEMGIDLLHGQLHGCLKS